MKIRPIIIFFLITAATMSCVDKNLYKDYSRYIVGEWQLTTLTKGETEVQAPIDMTFQFTADRQIIINNKGNAQKSTYFIKENTLTVDDGVITDIREEIAIQTLDDNQMILSFEIDGQKAKMTFTKIAKE